MPETDKVAEDVGDASSEEGSDGRVLRWPEITSAAIKERAESSAGSSLLPVEWAEEIEPHCTSLWLIKNTLPQQGLALLYGHPASGKSFLALDIAMHVALGRQWNGLRTRPGLAVYVAAEGQLGVRNRIVAFRRHHLLTGPIPLALIPSPIDLYRGARDHGALRECVREAAARYAQPPALIIIDTLSKTIGAGKENTDDLAVYVANCSGLATTFNCCVLVVHHRPKDSESLDPRGHSSLKGGVDTVILVEAGNPRRARIMKQKDGEEGDLLSFKLQTIELGRDEDGEGVSSCVVVPTDNTRLEQNPFHQKLRKLSPNHRIVYDQLGKALELAGIVPPSSIPSDLLGPLVGKVVDLRTFADRSIQALRTGTDNKPDSARKTFDRARAKLQAIGLIAVFGEFAWLIS